MSAEMPDTLTLKELAKAMGYIVTSNCCAQPKLFCWMDEIMGDLVYTASPHPEVGDVAVQGTGNIIGLCDPIAEVLPNAIRINTSTLARYEPGDIPL